jgi:hypothetical protein
LWPPFGFLLFHFSFLVFHFGVLTPPQEKPRVKPRVAAAAAKAAPKIARFQNPFTRKNYLAFAVGLGLLLVGYICLAQPPANGFLSLTLAPILLVAGYGVVFPYAIMARDKPKQADKPTS